MLGQRVMGRRDAALYDLFWLADHVLGRRRVQATASSARARLHKRIEAGLRASGDGHLRAVPEVRRLSPAAFRRDYVNPCLPVVFRGVARGWGAHDKWTPEFFAERYGDDEVQLISASDEDVGAMEDGTYEAGKKTITVGDVVDSIHAGTDDYARFIPLLHNHLELVDDLDLDWIQSMRPPWSRGMFYQMFMGGAGTNTSLHNAIGSNLFLQIHGRKTWWLYPPTYAPVFNPPLKRAPYFFSLVNPAAPDLEKHPLFQFVDGYKVTLEPGDVLYNPPFYWHYVQNPTASIGVGVRWYDLASILKTSAIQGVLTLLSSNPPVWVGRRLRRDFTKVFVQTR